MILVTGATGTIGRFLVPLLMEKGAPVRVLVRDPAKAQVWAGRVEVAVGDMANPGTLPPALKGVDTVFLLSGADGDGVAQTRNLLEALQSEGARPRIVLLSSLGAEDPSVALARVHADRETLVRDSGLPWTMLRPGMFMTNTLNWARSIRAQGEVLNAYAQGSLNPIAPSDIAKVAAVVLTDPSYRGRVLALTGPEALTTPEQVAILARVLGRTIGCREITVEQSVAGMVQAGYPELVARMLGDLTLRVRQTEKAPVFDTVRMVTGSEATTFEAWAKTNAAAWK